jgi:hypothetical protein
MLVRQTGTIRTTFLYFRNHIFFVQFFSGVTRNMFEVLNYCVSEHFKKCSGILIGSDFPFIGDDQLVYSVFSGLLALQGCFNFGPPTCILLTHKPSQSFYLLRSVIMVHDFQICSISLMFL